MPTFLPRSIIVRRDAATKRRRVAHPSFWFEQQADVLVAQARARELELAEKNKPPRFNPIKEPYPPAWKPIKESPEFKYGWLKKFWDWDLCKDCGCGPDIYTHFVDKINFVEHILDTRGYDVDCAVPECKAEVFSTMDFRSVEWKDHEYYQLYKRIAEAALTEINIHAEMHGESYAFNGLEKIIHGPWNHGNLLMTFTVKQLSPTVGGLKTVQAMEFARGERFLIGWRFKPEASAADCST